MRRRNPTATIRQGLEVALDVALEHEADGIVETIERIIDGKLPHYTVVWEYEFDEGVVREALESLDDPDAYEVFSVVVFNIDSVSTETFSLGGVVFHLDDRHEIGKFTVEDVLDFPNEYQREVSLELLDEAGWKDIDAK